MTFIKRPCFQHIPLYCVISCVHAAKPKSRISGLFHSHNNRFKFQARLYVLDVAHTYLK